MLFLKRFSPTFYLTLSNLSIGLGTFWDDRTDGACPSDGGSKWENANREFKTLSGCSFDAPTETGCGHWKMDNCFYNSNQFTGELMAPIITRNSKLSRVTIGALEDQGYQVNYEAADSMTKADLGSGCQCRRRLTGDSRVLGKKNHARRLSDAGREHAMAEGRAFLNRNERSQSLEEDSCFVVYEEDEVLHGVYVTL